MSLNFALVQLTISDGKDNLSLPFHVRLESLMDSGVLSRFSIIWASDIRVKARQRHKKYTLLDADEAAPNPGRVIGSSVEIPTDSGPSPADQQKAHRLAEGLPWITVCQNKSCHVSSDLNQCSQCKFFA